MWTTGVQGFDPSPYGGNVRGFQWSQLGIKAALHELFQGGWPTALWHGFISTFMLQATGAFHDGFQRSTRNGAFSYIYVHSMYIYNYILYNNYMYIYINGSNHASHWWLLTGKPMVIGGTPVLRNALEFRLEHGRLTLGYFALAVIMRLVRVGTCRVLR